MGQPTLLSMGTRPEIIKMAPLYRALRAVGHGVSVLHTGQHDSMAWPLYKFFDMLPDHALELHRHGTSLSHLSAALLTQTQQALDRIKPRAVLVHGDTSSAAMVSIAAFYNHIPVGHVEAGLRSHDREDPFPEEMNRGLIGRFASWHFAPTPAAVDNLRRENVAAQAIHLVGNTIVDATRWASAHLETLPGQGRFVLPAELARVPGAMAERRLVLVTAHRRENWGNGIDRICSAVRELLVRHAELLVVWPVHVNPTVHDAVHRAMAPLADDAAARLFLCEPLDYPALMYLLRHAWLILTDSGGIQEEAVSLRVPVLVLRDTTERPELLDVKAGLLVGTQPAAIVQAFERLWSNEAAHAAMRAASNPFGDGRASQRISSLLQERLVRELRAA